MEEEVQTIKKDIAEIKEAVKDVSTVVNDMRVLLAGNYITKQDFEDYKKGTENSRRWWSGFVIALAGAFATVVNVLWSH
ncbi:hypothetical protein [Desulfosporosinus meridiei]|uniref:Uncharacterized protein n=1 Tax=Desulfosporosinus meridiei (strain ATCC BAA-275 / DSM 13257 / KCTC 12902 / NCIMB 13706 / S10) TaxID=768704 RepID=J7IUL6_DESMD|nr:hypothetical protein [Desulfosporosinus meridiei]AFQ42391.1 hypothetical protein Desmer_0330 [Desulfosporosinus meridiei DSM 13257]